MATLQIGTVQIVLEVVNRIVRGPLVLGALGAACVWGWRPDKAGHGLWNHVAQLLLGTNAKLFHRISPS